MEDFITQYICVDINQKFVLRSKKLLKYGILCFLKIHTLEPMQKVLESFLVGMRDLEPHENAIDICSMVAVMEQTDIPFSSK